MKRPRATKRVTATPNCCRWWPPLAAGPAVLAAAWLAGCAPANYRAEADRAAYAIIAKTQADTLGYTEPFTIETPAQTLRRRLLLDQHLPYATGASLGTYDIEPIPQWPDPDYLKRPDAEDTLSSSFPTEAPLRLTLSDALQIAAHESREYQARKEAVFRAALELDLERDAFRLSWAGVLDGLFQSSLEREVVLDDKGHTDKQTVSGLEYGGQLELTQRFKNGLTFTGALGLDLVSLLTQERLYSRGIIADVTATLPLLRGAGQFVVTEPLTQAERNVVYAIYNFEQFKRSFAVDVAAEYLAVLQQQDQIRNAEENYRSLITSTRRARRLADAGWLRETQVDQSRQDELRARQRWVAAQEAYKRRLDAFKTSLGLPVDAAIEPDRAELDRLAERAQSILATEQQDEAPSSAPAADAPVELVPPGEGLAGPYELSPEEAVLIAIAHRPDLRVAAGRVHDAQRVVAVAADQLRADVTLLGRGSAGARRTLATVNQPDARLRPDEGVYSALLTIDLPLERTAERNRYRSSLIGLEQAVRDLQELEDQVKLAVRSRLSELLEARESIRIQAAAVAVAKRRVEGTRLSLEAGRLEIRDVLEAQEALVSAQNALTSALVNYRLSELALQRDLGVLKVNEQGLWQEFLPKQQDSEDATEDPE